MGYETMGKKTKPKKAMKETKSNSMEKRVKKPIMPITDPLEVGKKNAVVERTRVKTKQTEDRAYKAKMKGKK
jgi:hypothetical protein